MWKSIKKLHSFPPRVFHFSYDKTKGTAIYAIEMTDFGIAKNLPNFFYDKYSNGVPRKLLTNGLPN